MATRKKATAPEPEQAPLSAMLHWTEARSGMNHKVLVAESEAGRFIIAKGGRELIHPDGRVEGFDVESDPNEDNNTLAMRAAEFALGQYIEHKEGQVDEDTQPA